MEQQRLAFLENALVPSPLSSSRDGERRVFTALENPLLGVLVDFSTATLLPFHMGSS